MNQKIEHTPGERRRSMVRSWSKLVTRVRNQAVNTLNPPFA